MLKAAREKISFSITVFHLRSVDPFMQNFYGRYWFLEDIPVGFGGSFTAIYVLYKNVISTQSIGKMFVQRCGKDVGKSVKGTVAGREAGGWVLIY